MIKAVSFDMLYTLVRERSCRVEQTNRDTLYYALQRVHETLYDKGYIDSPYLSVDMYKLYKDILRDIREKIPFMEVWHKYRLMLYLSKLGIKPNHRLIETIYNVLIDAIIETYTMPIEHKKILNILKEEGFIIIITTATGSHDIPLRTINKFGLSELVDIVYSTQLTGLRKNHELFYQKLVEILNIKPNELIHVGDSIEYDYMPAHRVGINAILYKPSGCTLEDPKPCIEKLRSILNLVNKL